VYTIKLKISYYKVINVCTKPDMRIFEIYENCALEVNFINMIFSKFKIIGIELSG